MPKHSRPKRPNNLSHAPVDMYFTQIGKTKAASYFGRVRKGQPEVYTAPFSGGEDIYNVIDDWKRILSSIKDRWPTLWEFENDLANKVGPLSVMKPLKERIADVRNYYTMVFNPGEPLDADAIAAVSREWWSQGHGNNGLRVQTVPTTVSKMKLSTNSGNPFFSKRRDVLRRTLSGPLVFPDDAVTPIQYWDGYAYNLAAILGWRGQEGGDNINDVKQRVVWMFPFKINISELQVYQPLIEYAQIHGLVPAWVSMDAVDGRITRMFDTKPQKDLIVCTDFSKFDQHFNINLQKATEYVLRSSVSDSQMDEWLDRIYPIKYHLPIIVNINGTTATLMRGPHGMGSGSGGTNADETIAHRALQYEAAFRTGALLNPNSQCLGDDGILTYPGITVEDVTEAYSSHGQDMNADKQYASPYDCTYLRRWHHKDYRIDGVCRGVYSTCRALGRLRYVERFYDPKRWGPKMVALRQLSIIENVCWHPLRDQFVEFCMKRDKYRLGLDIPGFLENIEQEAEKAIDYMPDFLGYTKSLQYEGKKIGIDNWWVVKYLKKRR